MFYSEKPYPYLLTGFIIGVIFAIMKYYQISSTLSYTWIGLYGLMFVFTYQYKHSIITLLLSTIIFSELATLPFSWQSMVNQHIPFSANVAAVICAYALNSFHISLHRNGLRINYESLFYTVWGTIGQLFIGFCFTGICWLILFLWERLFQLIGINIFYQLFDKNWFIIWSIPFFLSIGLYITIVNGSLTHNLRSMLIAMCRYLFPPLAAIGLLFLISFAVQQNISQPMRASAYDIFLLFTGFSIVFLNGVYEYGQHNQPYPRIILWICQLFVITTPVFMVLAFLYNPNYLFVNLTGLYVITNMFIMLVYTLSYAIIAMCCQKPWMKGIQKANIILSIFMIITILIINHPWFIAFYLSHCYNIK